jgi:hypothetical protein
LNLSQIRDLAYKLANTYSADGVVLAPSDTADIKLAFNDFVNTAQSKFAEKDKIEAVTTIVQTPLPVDVEPSLVLNPLPSDLVGINKVIFLDNYGNRGQFTDYTIEMANIVINSDYEGTFFIYHYKRPVDLVLDTDVPQIKPEYHRYLAYYCAGEWLFSTGNQANGLVYLNRFDSFLTEMKPSIYDCGSGISNETGW